MEYKFEHGQIVRHGATKKGSGARLIIISRGTMQDVNGATTKIYFVSYARAEYGPESTEFNRAFLTEEELKDYNEE